MTEDFELTAEVSDLTFADPYHTAPVEAPVVVADELIAVAYVPDSFEFPVPVEEPVEVAVADEAQDETAIGAWVIYEGYSAFQLNAGVTHAEYVAAGEPFGPVDAELF